MRFAVVDMGSNTLKFTVAERNEAGEESILVNRADTVRLAAGISRSGMIAPERAERALTAMREYDTIAKALRADVLLCVATAALRMARNGSALVSAIERDSRWRVRVIDGEDEARLVFLGLVQSLDPRQRYLVLDIGGGSTEAILVDGNELQKSESNVLGSGTLADSCFEADPPGTEAVTSATSSAKEALVTSPVLAAAGESTLLLSGGNGVFLHDLAELQGMLDAFSPDRFGEIVQWLASHPAASFADQLGIAEERARMLPAGSAIVQAAIDLTDPVNLEARPSGIRGGLILEWQRAQANPPSPGGHQDDGNVDNTAS